VTDYEYGVDWKNPKKRDKTPHRFGYTSLAEAEAFLVNDPGDNFKWSDIFHIVRRPVGEWEVFTPIVERKPATGPLFPSLPNLIGKDCLPNTVVTNNNICGYPGCTSAAYKTGGYCGEFGCNNCSG
jgi:hypothetical protein